MKSRSDKALTKLTGDGILTAQTLKPANIGLVLLYRMVFNQKMKEINYCI